MNPDTKKEILKLVSCCFILLLVASCKNSGGPTAIEQEMDNVIAKEDIQPRSQVPDAVSAALLAPTIQKQSPNNSRSKSRKARFNVSAKDLPADEFFYGLIEGSGFNMVVQPNVEGTISLDLTEVTIEEVLEVVRDVYGYEFKDRNGIYTIYPRELRTQIFHVNYLDVKRVGISDTSVQIGKIEGRNSNASNRRNQQNNENTTQSGSLLGLIDEETRNSGVGTSPGTRIVTLNKTDFWSDIHRTIIAIIGGEREDRMVLVTPQAGMVVVKAMPNELNSVREFLERSELSVKRQVMLEAKILEVRLDESFEAGINWSAISGQILRFDNVSSFESPNTILDATDNGMLVSSIISVQNISTLLDLLETQGSVQVLSSPRISTVNNQKAVIRVGSDEFFVTGITDNTTSNASSTTSSPTIDLDSFFSGIALDVTPQIAENGDVILHIHPVITDVVDQQKTLVLGNEIFELPLALRDIRETDTIVWAKNGQVVVLGGLMLEGIRESDGKRPVLGDIPILNSLFKTRANAKTKTELVILLQPIVIDDETWGDSVSESRERIRTLGDEYRTLFSREPGS
jgi:MSHA biogenesis protein MshL